MSELLSKKFYSLKELEQFVQEYEKNHYINLYRRDSVTIEKIAKKCPLKAARANLDLKFNKIIYTCAKGGRTFKSRSLGKRKANTFKEDCQMKISIELGQDGQYLQIKKIIEEHNHDININSFSLLPKQRRLDSTTKEEVIKLKKLKCNNFLLKEFIENKTGKNLLLRDISNIKVKNTSTSDLTKLFEILNQNEATVKFCTNEDNVLFGIYYQSRRMQTIYSHYPEILLLDATYKLNNLRFPLYILMSINGNNEGDVVAVFLLENETSENISLMMEYFKISNPSWNLTRIFLTDKDFSERGALARKFPNSKLLLCLFHVLKAFRTNVTTQNMQINSDQRDCVLNILQKLAYAASEEEYNKYFSALKSLDFPLVTKYFEENWHNIRNEWVHCYKKEAGIFNVQTTNHLESLNNKIKLVCSKFNTLEMFFEEFLVLLKTRDTERKSKASNMFNKRQSMNILSPTEDKYCKLVTPFAFRFIEQKLKQAEKVILELLDVTSNIYKTKTSLYNITPTSCSCLFFVNMTLPCEHIFKAREACNLQLFEEELIPYRFKKNNYISCYFPQISENESQSNMDNTNVDLYVINNDKKKKILSSHEKYKKCMLKCQKLCSILADCSTEKFYEAMEKLDYFTNEIVNENNSGKVESCNSNLNISPSGTNIINNNQFINSETTAAQEHFEENGWEEVIQRVEENKIIYEIKPNDRKQKETYDKNKRENLTLLVEESQCRSEDVYHHNIIIDNNEAGSLISHPKEAEFCDNINENERDSAKNTIIDSRNVNKDHKENAETEKIIIYQTKSSHDRKQNQKEICDENGRDNLTVLVENLNVLVKENQCRSENVYHHNIVDNEAGSLITHPEKAELCDNKNENESDSAVKNTIIDSSNVNKDHKENTETDNIEDYKQIVKNKLKNVKLPVVIKRRGRPKGFATTVVGLKKRKRCTAFLHKAPQQKQKYILEAILPKEMVKKCLYEDHVINKNELKESCQLKPYIFEDDISLSNIKQYFTDDAYLFLKITIEKEKSLVEYICTICLISIKTTDKSIRCDSCLNWFHKTCSCLNKFPKKNILWFCLKCK